jgi:hypothetical protein
MSLDMWCCNLYEHEWWEWVTYTIESNVSALWEVKIDLWKNTLLTLILWKDIERLYRYRGCNSKYNVNKTFDWVFPSHVAFLKSKYKTCNPVIQLRFGPGGRMDQASACDEDGLVHWAESGEVWATLGFRPRLKSLNWLLVWWERGLPNWTSGRQPDRLYPD